MLPTTEVLIHPKHSRSSVRVDESSLYMLRDPARGPIGRQKTRCFFSSFLPRNAPCRVRTGLRSDQTSDGLQKKQKAHLLESCVCSFCCVCHHVVRQQRNHEVIWTHWFRNIGMPANCAAFTFCGKCHAHVGQNELKYWGYVMESKLT